MAYLLDANVFIQAKNLHYGLDFCPAFWDWLIAGNASKQVFSIEKICRAVIEKRATPKVFNNKTKNTGGKLTIRAFKRTAR